jgi:hypothetical protein
MSSVLEFVLHSLFIMDAWKVGSVNSKVKK